MIQRLLGLAVLSCLLGLAFLFMPETAESQTCPGFAIEGFGKDTTGGCGGKIINITNLNNSGCGKPARMPRGKRHSNLQANGIGMGHS